MAIDYQDPAIPVAEPNVKVVRYGPWKGSMRSRPADRVPPEFLAESDSDTPSSNYVYSPTYGFWKRRLGQTQKFDTFGSATGNLPAKWSARSRVLKEFNSEACTDSVPTMAALLTKETLTTSTNVDDGRFSNLWVRDQVNSLDYTLGSDFSTTTYPATPGDTAVFRWPALWHDSGDGGLTRAVTEFDRRFIVGGSRGNLVSGAWMYHPSFFGTPSRWRQVFTSSAALTQTATPDGYDPNFSTPGAEWTPTGGPSTLWECVDDSGTDLAGTDYARLDPSAGGSTFYCSLGQITDPGVDTGFKLNFTLRSNHANTFSRLDVTMANRGGASFMTLRTFGSPSHTATSTTEGLVTTSFARYTINITAGEMASANFGVHWTVAITFSGVGGGGGFWDIADVDLTAGSVTVPLTNRLMPSGPIPAVHAGTLTHGTATGGTSESIRPDGTTSAGSWSNSTGGAATFATIGESTTDDTDYIRTTTNNDTCTFTLSDPTVSPSAGDTVTVNWRSRAGNSFLGAITCELLETATSKASSGSRAQSSGFTAYSFTLTAAQISSVTTWANVRIKFTAGSSVTTLDVSQAYVTISTGSSAGGWTGSDRFFYGVIPVFEDDSTWMPTIPRFPNDILSTGFNLFTVDSANPTTTYDSVLWQNIPVLWYGNKQKLLVRSEKIDSSTTDNLALTPFGMRIVAVIDNSVTSYKDTFADDDSLQLDSLLVRYDHIMPPRSRYIFGGDMRVCHGYGALNPCAIIIAPVGRAADYDLNLPDTDDTLYDADGSYMRVTAGTQLELIQADGNATVSSTTTLSFTTYNTLEKLVDAINATSVADNGQQWRAQLCPGVDPSLNPATVLLPHKRAVASVTTTNNSTTISGTGLGKVAIGSRVSGTGIAAGTYVTQINTDTSSTDTLTLSAVATASGTVTLTFYTATGDTATTATAAEGWQRVIAASLPGFLYLNRTYLDTVATEKQSIWMTTATPGGMKSAPNAFSGKVSNKFFPANAKAGKVMGGVGIDQGFRVYFENQRGVIDNVLNSGSGADEDYRLKITHETSGCCSWASVSAGTRFGICAAPEGIIASDLRREILLSEAIWAPPSSDSPTGLGDFSYEIPQSIAATAQDNDNAMLYTAIMRDRVYVNYRTSTSTTHPNRQVIYDFSSGVETSGLEALLREGKEPFGWSTPLSRSMTCMGEGRRSDATHVTDGAHVYGWNDANAGSTGDGRIDEIDTAQTDNGTAISAVATTPWLRDGSRKISFMKAIWEHATTTSTTTAFDFHRSLSDETYSFTPTQSATLPYIRDPKEMTLPARSPTAAGFFGFRQTAGTAHEIRSIEVYFEELDTYS